MVMRALALNRSTTLSMRWAMARGPFSSSFSSMASLQVVDLGTCWGAITAPVLKNGSPSCSHWSAQRLGGRAGATRSFFS
jgi:hypothetical protein